jgi:hypothetical protein
MKQPIEVGDIIIHSDSMGLWAGYVTRLTKAKVMYRIIKRLSSDQDTVTSYECGAINFKKLLNITNTHIGNKLRQHSNYKNILRELNGSS